MSLVSIIFHVSINSTTTNKLPVHKLPVHKKAKVTEKKKFDRYVINRSLKLSVKICHQYINNNTYDGPVTFTVDYDTFTKLTYQQYI